MKTGTLTNLLKWLIPATALLYLPLAYLLFFQNIRDLDDIKAQERRESFSVMTPSTTLSIVEPPWVSVMKPLKASVNT